VLKRKSFTLVEILVVIVIIAILAALALPGFSLTKERSLDREAKANLRIIQAAEKIYRMEVGYYYPPGATTVVISDINSNLKLGLPSNQVSWTYRFDNSVGGSEKATATRAVTGGRTWTILFPPGSSDTPCCTPSSDCPAGSGC